MAISNRERISRTLDLLREGVTPFVERELNARLGDDWTDQLDNLREHPLKRKKNGTVAWDTQSLVTTMQNNWQSVFRNVLGPVERGWVSEIREVRNQFAHEEQFSSEDTLRALDTIQRLLVAVTASEQASEVEKSRTELMRTVYDQQARTQTRRTTVTLEGTPKAGLKPWREIITPHQDVASGRFQQAEFAADLAQVHRGEGSDEYRDPVEFFHRTYLTEGLCHLLKDSILRLSGKGGDPVVELQTNFGGGKTHSMLALYHLFSSGKGQSLPGIEDLMTEVEISKLPEAPCAVLVGTALSPAQPHKQTDGMVTNTLWGEMAWQLGGAEGYKMIAKSDASGVSPGTDDLVDLLNKFSPCIVLIDEWVAYVRQLYHVPDLPAGSFDASMTFAHVLSEAAKRADRALVVASLPASQIEIGGEGGEQALDRLKNTFGRVESSWRPATADEGFEIVRRRLFEPLTDKDQFAAREAAIKAFSDMYKSGAGEFPQGCGEAEYKRRMEGAYPIHPELFERLYNDWGSLDKFQRTRGVLRLMACVIHALWERDDRSLIILPSSIPIDNSRVQFELVRYLDSAWDAVIAKDIDGSSSVPLAIDQEIPTLGRYSATRRVARTIYMGSAPTSQGENPGIDDRRIRLGCAQPGETVATFGDALRRLADRGTYLYVDGSRYWYSTHASVSRLAEDRAAEMDEHNVASRIVEYLRKDNQRGDFAGVHIAPDNSGDVPDEMEARLVVLGPDYAHVSNADDTKAIKAADEILTKRGNSQRLYKNTLVFLAPDKQRLPDLEQSVRLLEAWSSIVADEKDGRLNIDSFQRRQAETRMKELDDTVKARITETWCLALTPSQPDPQNKNIEWSSTRLQGQDPLAVRAGKKLVQEESLLTRMGPARLKLVLDQHLWQDADHLSTNKLWEYLASYLYLSRLRDKNVMAEAIEAGISELVCDHFAYAERFDEETGKYEGLKMTGGGSVIIDSMSVLVKPDVAASQDPAPAPTPEIEPITGGPGGEKGPDTEDKVLPKRFYGAVELNPDRSGLDMGTIAQEVLQHLTVLPNTKMRVTVEIEAETQEGVSEDTQRTVTENCQTLKFKDHGFEKD